MWRCPVKSGIYGFGLLLNRNLPASESVRVRFVTPESTYIVEGSVKMGQPIQHPVTTVKLGAIKLLSRNTNSVLWRTTITAAALGTWQELSVEYLRNTGGRWLVSPVVTYPRLRLGGWSTLSCTGGYGNI